MIRLIEENREALKALCQRYHVARLEVFGSAVDGSFEASSSDLDFLVEYSPIDTLSPWDAYFGLLEELEGLFGCPVDLVMPRAIRNPYLLKAVNETRRVLYAA